MDIALMWFTSKSWRSDCNEFDSLKFPILTKSELCYIFYATPTESIAPSPIIVVKQLRVQYLLVE